MREGLEGAEGRRAAVKMDSMAEISGAVDSSAIMLIIYGLMVVSIIAIPFLYFAIYSGFIRFLLMFMGLLMLMLFLSARVAEKVPGSAAEREGKEEEKTRNGLASVKETVERAFSGYQSSQIIIRDTLRDVLVRKIAVKNRMEPWEIEELCTKGRVEKLVSDPELQKLLAQRYVRPKGAERGILARLRRRERGKGASDAEYREWLKEMMKKIDEI